MNERMSSYHRSPKACRWHGAKASEDEKKSENQKLSKSMPKASLRDKSINGEMSSYAKGFGG